MKKILLSIPFILSSIGCTITDSNAIVTGIERSPISTEQVRIYRNAPSNYDEIAMVSSAAGHDFLKDSDLMNTAIKKLKQEAAKLGANGVLLTEIKERDKPAVVTGVATGFGTSNGVMTQSTGTVMGVNRGDTYTRLKGLAIFVKDQ